MAEVKTPKPFPDTDLASRTGVVEGASARRESSLRHVFHGRPFDLSDLVGVRPPKTVAAVRYVSASERCSGRGAYTFNQTAAHSCATNYGTRGLLSGKHSPFCSRTLCWQLWIE